MKPIVGSNDPALRARVDAVATVWIADATHMRQFSKVNPVADTLEGCALKLRTALDDDALTEVDTRAYAALHRKSVQTVRRWCQRGFIVCRKDGQEYYIPRGTPAPTFAAQRQSA